MGDKAAAAEAAEPEEKVETTNADQGSDESDPLTFNVGDEEDKADDPGEKSDDKKDDKPAAPDYGKQIEELKADNARQQALLNKKFYDLRQQKKQHKPEGDDAKPAFTEAQLLKIMEEHQGEPAVLLQVMKHMTETAAAKTEKKAVQSSEIKQQQMASDSWLRQNVPQLYEEGSDLRMQTDNMKSIMHLDDHPLGDMLAVAAAQLAAYPDMIKQAREDERKKALAESAEATRKKDVKNAAPAGGRPSKAAAGAASDSEFNRQGKDMGLTGDALKIYVKMRKDAAKPSKQVMEA